MAGDAADRIELIIEVVTEYLARFLFVCSRVQTVGKEERDVVLVNTGGVQLAEDDADR